MSETSFCFVIDLRHQFVPWTDVTVSAGWQQATGYRLQAAGCRNTTITTVSCYRLAPLRCSSVFIVLVLYVPALFVSLCFYFTFFVILALSFCPRRFFPLRCFAAAFVCYSSPFYTSDLPSCFCLQFSFIHVCSFFLPLVLLLCSILPFFSSSYFSLFLSFSFYSTCSNYVMEVFSML